MKDVALAHCNPLPNQWGHLIRTQQELYRASDSLRGLPLAAKECSSSKRTAPWSQWAFRWRYLQESWMS